MSTPAAPVVAGSLVVAVAAWAATAVMVAWGTVVAASASVPMAEIYPGLRLARPQGSGAGRSSGFGAI
jgi:hypothetical protein